MENLKIRVTTEQESKEAQELLVSIGGVAHDAKQDRLGLIIFANNIIYSDWLTHEKHYDSSYELKEITLPELKDMVVLKRNNPKDATHTDQDGWKWYIGADSYVWQVGNPQQLKQWDKSPLDHVDLKPIQKEQIVKEYLDPNNGYEFINWLGFAHPPGNFIEVPEGADSFRENLKFYNTDCSKFYSSGKYWANSTVGHGFKILWQRSLNDKVASAEVARQELKGVDNVNNPPHYAGNGVNVILQQRQSQYGDFRDVAETTRRLLGALKDAESYENLSHSQLEAMHMICSKLARIVNGDVDYVDNWIDIAGYSQLIVNQLNKEAS